MNRISPASAVSSSAIVAKVLMDLKRTANPETEMILGIIMFEDIFLAVYLTLVSGLVLSGATSFGQAATSAVIALGYMLAVLAVDRKATSWLNRALHISSEEVFLLILAILGPWLTMRSRSVFEMLNRVFRWRKPLEVKENPPRVDDAL